MKVRLTIDETVRYQSTIIIEQPEDMTDDELEEILKKVERKCSRDGSVKDVAFFLKEEYGIDVLEVNDSFPDNPTDSEVEIIDVSDVREVQKQGA
jgi:hypothetical protein